jgi:hypothetical protein
MRGVVIVLLASCAIVEADSSISAQQPVFRAATDVVLVPVTVLRGRTPVTGLGPEDFLLLDNGVRQEVESIARDGRAIDVTFVAGAVLRSQIDELTRARMSSDRFRSLLSPDDSLRIVRAAERVHERPMRPASEPAAFGLFLRTHGTSLNDALVFALMRPVDPDRGHLVVAFTGGLESWSTLGADLIPAIARRADAVLHAVVPGPPLPALSVQGYDGLVSDVGHSIGWCCRGPSPRLAAEWRATYDAIDEAVRATGGSLHHISTGAETFQRILDEFRSSYVLRYTPRGVDRAGWHEVHVKVTRPGSFTVRSRKGYEGGR